MHAFLSSLGHLFWKSLTSLVGGWMGTTLLALALVIVNYWVAPWIDAKLHGGMAVKDRRLTGSLIITGTTWLLLFGISVIHTVYTEHTNLVLKNQALAEANRQFSGQIDALSTELQKEKQENAALKEQVPSETSLKIRAFRAANEYERLFRRRAKDAPTCNQTSTMSPEEQRAAIEPCNKYMFETMAEYDQKIAPEVMALVEIFRAKGMNVKDIENCAPHASWCGTTGSVQLIAFAARLDAKINDSS